MPTPQVIVDFAGRIDTLVYELYGLTDEGNNIVEDGR